MVNFRRFDFAVVWLLVVTVSFLAPFTIRSSKAVEKRSVSALSANTLKIAFEASGPGTLDPHYAAMNQDRAVSDMVFNGLLRYEPGNAPVIEPDLAENLPEPEMENGKQVWTLKIRKGIMFHPGPKSDSYELTSDDVVFSLKKSADPKRSAYSGEYSEMGFEKSDRYTVRILLKKPLSPILFLPKITNYSGGFIISKKAFERMGEKAFAKHPVGTGPFMFQRLTDQNKVLLKANPNYFRGRPLLDGVEVSYISSLDKREKGLENKTFDVIRGSIQSKWIETWNKGHVKVDVHGVGQPVIVHFNMDKPPMDNVNIRKAIAYALNRKSFIEQYGAGVAQMIYSIVPAQFLPGGLTWEETDELGLTYTENLEKARALMQRAGYPKGFSIRVISSEMAVYYDTYRLIKEQLARININVNIDRVSHSMMHKMIRLDSNPLVVYGAWRPNADVFLTHFFHSDSIVKTGKKPETNFSHYDKID